MNHLKGSLSPYLIQHANQAIDWYPWGPEAFAKARDEGKPILLSIGYSTCHWCHVMARESFDDQEVAELLNTYFVSIKVDREERPDIDAVYMAACIAMTGVGGWPLTIVMDAQQEPFFAATYLPKKAYYNRPGLMELLSSIVTLWEEDREGIKERQDRILDMIEEQVQGGKLPAQNLPLTEGSLTQGLLDLSRTFDPKDGGFGRAPKFPTPHKIFFLQAMQAAYNTETAQSMARTTLDAMARGGIFDPIAGGFARYSTDNQWLVPHFEKMLIDNALLAVAYLRQYQLDGDSHDLYVAKKTLSYMAQTLSSPGKAFYSAQDAESHGREGAFYALSFEDLLRALGAERAPAFAKAYGFTEEGNFHGANIPNRIHALHLTPPEAVFEEDLKKLDGYRKERLPLYTDQKIILSWNALAAYAFVVAYEVTGQEEYLEIAYEKRGIIERELRFEEGGFARAERAGLKSGPAQLDDLAALARLDLALYRVNGQFDFLYSASKLLETIEDGFLDEKDGGYFMTSVGDETLIVRPKEWSDGAQMSANALMVGLLNELWQMTGIEVYKERLNALIAAYQTLPSLSLLNHAHFHREFLYVLTAAENVVTTANQEGLGPWREYLAKPSGSLRTLVLLDEFGRDYFLRSDSYLGEIPYKNDRWYLCQNFSCQKPAKSFEDLGLL